MSLARMRAWLLILALASVLPGIWAYGQYLGPFSGHDQDSIILEIPRGASPAAVASLLADHGVIRSQRVFTMLARASGSAGSLQAGEYQFESHRRPDEVLAKIARGGVLLHRITIPEGLTGAEIAGRIAEAGLAELADLQSAFEEVELIEHLDPEADNLEGYLFPDTYHFARGSSSKLIYGEMVRRFGEEFDDELRSRLKELGLSIRQATTLASLVEKETSVPGERARISAVFHNRLKIGMALQCDPTVIFALNRAMKYRGQLTLKDLEFDSPYNTYQYSGLPPGPIASPGSAALEAAVRPDDARDLYFVADGTGGHAFSRSLSEHLRAVAKYRRIQKKGA